MMSWRAQCGLAAGLRVHSRFLAGAAWVLASAVGSRLAVLIATVLISRILAPVSFGRLVVVQLAVTVLAGISGLGIGVALTKRVAEARHSSPALAGRYVGAGLLATVGGALCVTAVYVATAEPLARGLLRTPHAATPLLASAPAIFFTTVLASLQGALAGLERFRQVATSQALQSVLPAVALVLGAWQWGLNGALAGFSLASAVAALVSAGMLRGTFRQQGIRITVGFESLVWRSMLKLGAAAFISSLIVTAALLLGQLFLAYQRHGYADVALFNIAFRWHLALLLLPGSMGAVFLPMMSRLGATDRTRQSGELFRFNIWANLLVTAIPAAAFALSARWLLGLSGSYYVHGIAAFLVLMVATVPSALNNVLSSASLSLGAIRAWLISDVVLAVAFIGTAVALIPAAGATGLALAYLAGYVATDAALARPVWSRLGVLRGMSPVLAGRELA